MILFLVGGVFLQLEVWDLIQSSGPLPKAVLVILVFFSLFSWAVIMSTWAAFRRARSANQRFLRAFRKAPALDTIAAASEQFNRSPLVTVFDFGYSEVARQMKSRGSVTHPAGAGAHPATRHERRAHALGAQHERAGYHRHGYAFYWPVRHAVWGIIDAFQQLSTPGAASLRGRCARHLRSSNHHRHGSFRCYSRWRFSTTFMAPRLRNSARAWRISSSNSSTLPSAA